jgi:hypothetical protein
MNWRIFYVFLFVVAVGMVTPGTGRSDDHRALPDILKRCQKMLDSQTAVLSNTRDLDKVIQPTAGKKASPEEKQAALKLATDEKKIVEEATKVIEILEAEGVVAFTESCREMRKDMERLQQRLVGGVVGAGTQAMEQNFINTLKEIVMSLRPV